MAFPTLIKHKTAFLSRQGFALLRSFEHCGAEQLAMEQWHMATDKTIDLIGLLKCV